MRNAMESAIAHMRANDADRKLAERFREYIQARCGSLDPDEMEEAVENGSVPRYFGLVIQEWVVTAVGDEEMRQAVAASADEALSEIAEKRTTNSNL